MSGSHECGLFRVRDDGVAEVHWGFLFSVYFYPLFGPCVPEQERLPLTHLVERGVLSFEREGNYRLYNRAGAFVGLTLHGRPLYFTHPRDAVEFAWLLPFYADSVKAVRLERCEAARRVG